MNLNDFALLKEDNDSYTIGHPKGKSMKVPKQGISERGHELISKLRKNQKFADGTPEGTDIDNLISGNSSSAPDQSAQNAPPDLGSQGDVTPPQNTPSADDEMSASANPEMQGSSPPPQSPPQNKNPLTAGLSEQNQALGVAQSNVAGGAAAEAQEGKSKAQAASDAADQLQSIQEDYDNRVADHQDKSDQLFQKLYNAPGVDYNRFWGNQSTGSKIIAGIGSLLSGAGSAASHQQNFAQEHINQAINNDIASQMNDQSKSMNLWKMNQQALGDDTQATLATQSQIMNVAKTMAMKAEATAQGAVAKARIAPLILNFDQQIQQNNRTRAMFDMANQPENGSGGQGGTLNFDPGNYVTSFVPKEQQGEALKEMGNLKQAVKMKQGLVQSYNDLNNKYLAGTLSPNDRESAIQFLAGPLAKLAEGRFNLEEAKNQMSALLPSKFESEETRKNKMTRIGEFFNSLVQTPTLDANNIPLKSFKSTNLNAVNNSYLPGTIVSVKGKPHKVGADGDTLTPI